MDTVQYDKLVFPAELHAYVREVTFETRSRDLPPGWESFIIYHPATNQYYSSKSVGPLQYYDLVRTKQPWHRWDKVAHALRQMLETSSTFQFFVLNLRSRAIVEGYLANIGLRRVNTKMGDVTGQEHVLFRVYSPLNKITRYAVAPISTPREELIEKVNVSMAKWLGSHTRVNQQLRKTMRVALRSQFDINRSVFEKESIVTATNKLVGKKHNEFRVISMHENIQAIGDFVRATTGG